MQIHVLNPFFFLAFPTKFRPHIWYLTFRFVFLSLNRYEEDVNDEMILQDDEDDSNIDLDFGDEFD